MNNSLKYILPVYLVVYFFFAFFWRTYLIWKRTKKNPYVLGKAENAHDFIGKIFRLVVIGIAAVVILFAASSEGYQFLVPIVWLEKPPLKVGGVILLLISLGWILIAQSQMGNSWRIGIDKDNQTKLVSGGIFQISRNPIFLGMRLSLMGFFLTMPNAFMLTIFVLGDVLMQIQVRLEEEHLSRTHGDDYESYRQKVRRWL
jgi:protein-S-isoprenylcysteine O-methyltransferase Ste14